MKVRLKCPAELAVQQDAFGYGRVYRTLTAELRNHPEITLVSRAKDADVQVTYCQPLDVWKVFHWWGRDRHPLEILYTTWETTQIPKAWLPIIETYAAVATPSKWNTKTLLNCGVDKPAFVIPHGVDTQKFPYVDRKFTAVESPFWPDKKFGFLWEGMAMNDRKGRLFVEAAFQRLREKYPDVWLIEKIYPFSSLDGMPTVININKGITQIRKFMTFEDYNALGKYCNAFIYPSRGEAFGLMPLEKLATGMAVATTAWSGQTEYLDDRFFWPIKYNMSKPGQDFFATIPFLNFSITPGQDAVPDVDDIFKAMCDIYENREKWKAKGKAGSEWVAKEWKWGKGADALVQAAKTLERASRCFLWTKSRNGNTLPKWRKKLRSLAVFMMRHIFKAR